MRLSAGRSYHARSNSYKIKVFRPTQREFTRSRLVRFIVERVLSRGRLRDWFALIDLYGLERIKKEAMKIRYLDEVTLSFC